MKKTFAVLSAAFALLALAFIGSSTENPQLMPVGAVNFVISIIMIWLGGGREPINVKQ